jgi:hypothetical protein
LAYFLVSTCTPPSYCLLLEIRAGFYTINKKLTPP